MAHFRKVNPIVQSRSPVRLYADHAIDYAGSGRMSNKAAFTGHRTDPEDDLEFVIFRNGSVEGESNASEIIGDGKQVIESVVIRPSEVSACSASAFIKLVRSRKSADGDDHGDASFERLNGRVAGRSPAVQEVRIPAFGGARQSLVNFLDRSSATC